MSESISFFDLCAENGIDWDGLASSSSGLAPPTSERRAFIPIAVPRGSEAILDSLMSDDEDVTAAATCGQASTALWASEEMNGDRDLCKAARGSTVGSGQALEWASEEMNGDLELRTATIGSSLDSGQALEKASEEMNGDRELRMTTIGSSFGGGQIMERASDEMNGDRELCTGAVAQNADSLLAIWMLPPKSTIELDNECADNFLFGEVLARATSAPSSSSAAVQPDDLDNPDHPVHRRIFPEIAAASGPLDPILAAELSAKLDLVRYDKHFRIQYLPAFGTPLRQVYEEGCRVVLKYINSFWVPKVYFGICECAQHRMLLAPWAHVKRGWADAYMVLLYQDTPSMCGLLETLFIERFKDWHPSGSRPLQNSKPGNESEPRSRTAFTYLLVRDQPEPPRKAAKRGT